MNTINAQVEVLKEALKGKSKHCYNGLTVKERNCKSSKGKRYEMLTA